ncbi:MAG TPA: LytTR family DNA-binding domain-containing protein [Pedobacter sp.]|uniref:LytR/AlgR family response regulator transcription factor n=1 Tax=Pedobacter sp. TaxID=1411316 RepID=UPI002C29E77B|nr:LytTR family DNA-binding domain-containing protein [Pedobacter sp.]HMI02634.1 LytTR family DNA-binding domain-containing protein [Pedobacter sp.]
MTNEFTCVIVDDSYLDRVSAEIEIKNQECFRLVGSFDNATEAAESIRSCQPDILFLDVDMPDISGLELFKSINTYNPLCVIISSYPEYALQSFELKVFDYILKPLTTERFKSTVDRLCDFIAIREKAQAYTSLVENEKVIFKEGHNVIYLNISDILYLEAFGDYTKVVTQKKNYLTLATLGGFLEELPADKFARIHRSYAVAKDQIRQIFHTSIAIGEANLPIGKTYRSVLAQIRN